MNRTRLFPSPLAGIAVLLLATCALPSPWTRAQEPAAAEGELAENGAAAPEESLREQTIYIPYTKLREVFEKEGRGVFLPYEQFQALWREAREKRAAPPSREPPVDAVITDIQSEATVGKDAVRVVARLTIEVLATGWHQVPLRLQDAAILSAKLGDQPARIVHETDRGYRLLVEKQEEGPQQISLELEYAKAFSKSPGQNTVSFQAPQAPVNRWRIRIPESGVKVNIQPLIAASEVPDEGGEEAPEEGAEETVVLAFVGAAPAVRIDWTPKAEGATGLAALATVQAEQEVTIDEGVIRTRTRLAYDISRAELSQLLVEVPADHKVVNVFDPNVRQWEVTEDGDLQKITVQLFEPTRGMQNVTVELEKFVRDVTMQELQAPVVRALGVGRQQGVVVVRLGSALRGETARRTGLFQVDQGDLPRALAEGKWDFSYRYASLPFELALSVEKVQPRIETDELVEAYLEPERLTLNLLAVYTIERAGVFQLEVDVPADFEVRQVRGRAVAEAEAVAVDSYHLEGEDQTRLLVNLSRKALGRVALFVELQRALNDPNLLTPTGTGAEIPVPVPRVASQGVAQSRGRLVVYAAESLRVRATGVEGLESISPGEAFQITPSVREERFAGTREILAYAYSAQDVSLQLFVERRKPHVTVRQLLRATIEAGVVKYEAQFFYEIRYSGVKALRLDVPEALAGQIRLETNTVQKGPIEPPPEDLAEGYVAWNLTGDSEFNGNFAIQFTWEEKIDELDVGTSIDLDIPSLRPVGADRAWGQIVIAKAETLDVVPRGQPSGLRPIDPQYDIMPGVQASDAAWAFEFHDDWSLGLTVTRYKLEEVKRTSIERAVLRMVVTRKIQDGPQHIAVQALYRIRSARQRLAIKFPADVDFDTEPLRINGRVVSLERGDKDEFFVPLVGQNPEDAFVLEVRYTVPGSQHRFDLPEFPSQPAVQKVYLCAYLPPELALLGSLGPWTSEWSQQWWTLLAGAGMMHSDTDLISWVTEGIDRGVTPTFQTDGSLYVFSTLRPGPPPDGSLRLVTFNRNALHGLTFALIALIGLGLAVRPLADRLVALAALLIALVICGVFFPSLSLQLLRGPLLAVVFLVIVVWLVFLAVGFLRRRQAAVAARPSAPPAPREESSEDSSEGASEEPSAESPEASSGGDSSSAAEPGAEPPDSASPEGPPTGDSQAEPEEGDDPSKGGPSDA